MTLKVNKAPVDRWWDVWAAIMVVTAITLVATRLWATDWVENLHVLVYLTFFAGVTGIALGYSRFSPLFCSFISSVYGIFITSWLFGTTVELEMTWRDRLLYHLGWRLRVAITQFIAGESFDDPILFLAAMSFLLWILGTTSAFLLVRKGTYWQTIVPLGFALLVISHYDQDLARNMRFLMSFLLLTLLILGRMTFLNYQQKWRREGILTTDQSRADLTKASVILAILIVAIAIIIPLNPQDGNRPSTIWLKITDRWYDFSDRFSSIFTFEASSLRTPKAGFFGDSMGLGTGTPDSEDIVLTVAVESTGFPEYRYYWRARSYDYYDGGTWTSSIEQQEKFLLPEEFNIQYPDWQGERPAAFTFTTFIEDMSLLFAAGTPTQIDHPVRAITNPTSGTEEDLIALLARPEIEPGETYNVEANLSLPTVSELRGTPMEYPDWLDPYLQLPEDFSERIREIAEGIAARNPHPYSTALDITRYLRITVDYSRTLPEIPSNVDPLEWFLFDEKSGFCNYYASAQVLMLRSVGIPARLAVGYAQGEFDPATNTYTVLVRDSHAWPEVYFPGYGWVIFEPTESQPSIFLPGAVPTPESTRESPILDDLPALEPTLRPDERGMDLPGEPMPGEIDRPLPEPTEVEEQVTTPWLLPTAGGVLLLSILFLVLNKSIRKGKNDPLPVVLERRLIKQGKSVPRFLHLWSKLTRMTITEKAYHQLGLAIRILGNPLNHAETPKERGETLAALLPEAKIAISDVVNEYELRQFSKHYSSPVIARKAARQIRQLAIKTRLRRLLLLGENDE